MCICITFVCIKIFFLNVSPLIERLKTIVKTHEISLRLHTYLTIPFRTESILAIRGGLVRQLIRRCRVYSGVSAYTRNAPIDTIPQILLLILHSELFH